MRKFSYYDSNDLLFPEFFFIVSSDKIFFIYKEFNYVNKSLVRQNMTVMVK